MRMLEGTIMVDFVMKFGNVETGRAAAKLLVSLGYPAVYFIHNIIFQNRKPIQYGTVEMFALDETIFMKRK